MKTDIGLLTITPDLGVFPLLIPADSLPLPVGNDLGWRDRFGAASCRPSTVGCVVGPRLLPSNASVKASKLRET